MDGVYFYLLGWIRGITKAFVQQKELAFKSDIPKIPDAAKVYCKSWKGSDVSSPAMSGNRQLMNIGFQPTSYFIIGLDYASGENTASNVVSADIHLYMYINGVTVYQGVTDSGRSFNYDGSSTSGIDRGITCTAHEVSIQTSGVIIWGLTSGFNFQNWHVAADPDFMYFAICYA